MVASPQPLNLVQLEFFPNAADAKHRRLSNATPETAAEWTDATITTAAATRPTSSRSLSRPSSRSSAVSQWQTSQHHPRTRSARVGKSQQQRQQQRGATIALPLVAKETDMLRQLVADRPESPHSPKETQRRSSSVDQPPARAATATPSTATAATTTTACRRGSVEQQRPQPLTEPSSEAPTPSFSPRPGSRTAILQGAADVAELTRLLHPKKKDQGFRSTFARLAWEIQRCQRQWMGAKRADGRTAGMPPPAALPEERNAAPNMVHSTEAASLLLQFVFSMPRGMPEREMLQPLAQELMHALFRDWPHLDSLEELKEEDLQPEALLAKNPWFTIVEGQRSIAVEAEARRSVAEEEAKTAKHNQDVLIDKLEAAADRVQHLEEQLLAHRQNLSVLDAENKTLHEKLVHEVEEKSKRQVMYLDCSEQLRDRMEELRLRNQELMDLKKRHAEALSQIDVLRQTNNELDRKVQKQHQQLAVAEAHAAEVPKLKHELEHYQTIEAVRGLQFAERVVQEVLETDMETICRKSRAVVAVKAQLGQKAQRGGEPPPVLARAMLDSVREKLKGLPLEIKGLKEKNELLRREAKSYRALVPAYNSDFADDLSDAYNADAPVHRQIFSMKDTRAFAGLGIGERIPLYLRAEGFVRHVFRTKAELEKFMEEFMTYFLEGRREEDITCDAMHMELYLFMKKRFDTVAELHEFAYAFICSLEAFRTDPDFELFDLMLSGAVHPSIMQDNKQMLLVLETLLRNCSEEAAPENSAQEAPPQLPSRVTRFASVPATTHGSLPTSGAGGGGGGSGSRPAAHRQGVEQVSRRIIRCAMQVMCPEKTLDFHNALQRALHATLQLLTEAARTPSTDSLYITDLFASSADETQTPFIEEVRRQHYIEVVRFTGRLARRLREAAHEQRGESVTADTLMSVLEEVDPKAKPHRLQDLRKIAFPTDSADGQQDRLHHAEVMRRLRRTVLLRPGRLWVQAEAKDVVQRLCDPVFHEVEARASNKQCICGAHFLEGIRFCRRCGVERPEEEVTTPEWRHTRVKGVKVLQPHSERGDPYATGEIDRLVENLRTPWQPGYLDDGHDDMVAHGRFASISRTSTAPISGGPG